MDKSKVRGLTSDSWVNPLNIRNSSIENLSVAVGIGHVENTSIGTVDKLIVDDSLTFFGVVINFLNNVMVNKDAVLILKHCVINHIPSNGMEVKGALVMENVTVYNTSNDAIKLQSSSEIKLSDVVFEEEISRLFFIDNVVDVEFDNVIMLGRKIGIAEHVLVRPLEQDEGGESISPIIYVDNQGLRYLEEKYCPDYEDLNEYYGYNSTVQATTVLISSFDCPHDNSVVLSISLGVNLLCILAFLVILAVW